MIDGSLKTWAEPALLLKRAPPAPVMEAALAPEAGRDFSIWLPGGAAGVLLVHGLTGTPNEMRSIAKRLNEAGYTVSVPQLAGHCQGQAALERTRYEDWLASLKAAYDRLAAVTTEVSVAGICAGGSLALLLAHQETRIRAVAVYSPCFQYDGHATTLAYRFAPLMALAMRVWPPLRHRTFGETAVHGIKDERLRKLLATAQAKDKLLAGNANEFPAMAVAEMFRLGRRLKRCLPAIEQPTLIIHAREDDLSNPRNARYMQRRLGGYCQIHWLEDSYHLVHLDRERGLVARLTDRFFSAQSPAHAPG